MTKFYNDMIGDASRDTQKKDYFEFLMLNLILIVFGLIGYLYGDFQAGLVCMMVMSALIAIAYGIGLFGLMKEGWE